MKYHTAWSRVRRSRAVAKAYNSASASVDEDSLEIITESERILKEADSALTVTQRNMIIRVCCDNKMASGADDLETLRRALQRLVKLWKTK